MRAIIVDDERLARKELKSLLKDYHEIEIVDECSSPDEAIKSIEKHNPDLLFLDIQMPEKTGFDLLQELDKTPKVIFVTAFDEYALKAFEVNALDYLMKPVDPDRLKETITKYYPTRMKKMNLSKFQIEVYCLRMIKFSLKMEKNVGSFI